MGLLGILGGVVVTFEEVLFGVLILVLSVLTFIPKNKKEVDLHNKRYREGMFYRGSVLKKWSPFPHNINFISVMRLNQKSVVSSTINITAMDATNIYQEFVINLVFDKRKKIKIGIADSFIEAEEIAYKTAEFLKADIYFVLPNKKYWKRLKTKL